MTLEYDFETATWVEISPVEVDRETYEEINRPSLRNNAKKFADRYKVLCEHLEEVNKEDGIADTLAFGILIDAAIRGDKSIPITSPELYSIYDKWIDQTSSLLWIGIQEWAQLRQYPIESLARDNIIFQAILQKNRTEVYICPHVIIDLHDFDIIIDRTNGIMQVFQNGNTPSLRERMIPDLGIENPDDLYKTFCDWVLTHIDVFQERNEKENAFRNKIMKDKKMNGLIMLERGKRLIFKGQLEKAIECFESARSSLLSPIYFWGAIAYQMQRIKFRYGSKIKDIHAIYFLAFEIIRYHLHATQNLDHGFKEIIINQTLDEDAEDFLKQLKNDQSFIESLKKPNPEIILIEKESLKLSNEEENQKQLAISAILALDFLQVSENMKDIAQSISFNGISIHKLKRELEDLVEDMNRNCLYEPPGAPQIEKLSNISGGNKAFIKKGNINELEDEK